MLIFVFVDGSIAGVEWKTVRHVRNAQAKGQSNTIVAQVFAGGGNVKQVFESVADENEMFQKGSYWLFRPPTSPSTW